MQGLTNRTVAAKLREMADTLELQQADGFRVRAYRRAAETVDALPSPLENVVAKGGTKALEVLPGIGRGIASAINEMLATGRWSQLERLLGLLEPEQLFQTLPGIGPELAAEIHDQLDVDTLEGLEVAAHDGRLETVPGIGPRRAEAIRSVLSERLGRRRLKSSAPAHSPPLAMLLEADREYRGKAAEGTLRKIAPKRFNPTGEAWLPVLHARRGKWDLTLLFSNTQKAHELRKTHDWVVIYCNADGEAESQCTVVTETHGPLAGRRVVRGREAECLKHYAP